MGAQLRYAMSVRRHSSALAQGRRHTPSRHSDPDAHWALVVQKGRGRLSTWHTPRSEQKSPVPQSAGPLQRCWHTLLTQRLPAPHIASVVHSPDGRLTHTSPWQTVPVGHAAPAAQELRHSLLMHTRPVPHWLLNRQPAEGAEHAPPRQI